MRTPIFNPRPTCLRCRRALSACWCDGSVAQRTDAELVFLQHPRESNNPIGTARMAHLAVAGSQLRVGIRFAADPVVTAMLGDATRRSVVLYPSADARPAEELRDSAVPLRIFILDGTWWQAKKLWRLNPWLAALPAYRLSPSAPGQYRIRREPAAHCLATIEAVSQLLDAMAGEQGVHAPMLRPFFTMVDRQITHSQSAERTPRMRKRPRAFHICADLQKLVASQPNLLVVHGEGNGWPVKKSGNSDIEIMQWLAIRPATGERFHALLKTRTRAPDVLCNQALTEAQLVDAIGLPEFLARWEAFTRPDDVWCSWGHFSALLMRQAGGTPSPAMNLHKLCNMWLRRRVLHVEDALQALGDPLPEAEFPGRGGRRIIQMAATVRALVDAVQTRLRSTVASQRADRI